MKRKRSNHSPKFKAEVAVAALKRDPTLEQLAGQFDVHQTCSTSSTCPGLGGEGHLPAGASVRERESWQTGTREGGQGTARQDRAVDRGEGFFIRLARSMGPKERKAMINLVNPLPSTQQFRILDLFRSSVYCKPVPLADRDLEIIRRIDEIHLKIPFYGNRRIRDQLRRDGYKVNRKKVRILMGLMGISVLYPRRRSSKPGKGHKTFPCLLKNLTIDRPNQVWATDIPYIPMATGILYLVAILDLYSRKVSSWRPSNNLGS